MKNPLLIAIMLAINTLIACVILNACGAGTPSAADQAAVGSYAAALQSCIAQAKLRDAGYSAYESCAERIDLAWGFKPEGGLP